MTSADHDDCLADHRQGATVKNKMKVLDAGSGTGTLCLVLVRVPGLRITALEPCSTLTDLLMPKRELRLVRTVQGFCDHQDDQSHFESESFDMITSRKLANCLYDLLVAFRNWHFWQPPGGTVLVMDGLFDRNDWSNQWDGIVDLLPLSACRTMATIPYLLEQCGFGID